MSHPFNDPFVHLLKEASSAAHTPEREDLLEGLLDGQEGLVQRTMEGDHEHAELLGDDFSGALWAWPCSMGARSFGTSWLNGDTP